MADRAGRIAPLAPVLVAAALLLSVLAPAAWCDRPDRVSDREIADAIDQRLLRDPNIPGDAIDVAVNGGRVTLDGTVGNLLARELASETAQMIIGVTQVDNRLEVTPPGRPDRKIAAAVATALAADPAVDAGQISAAVVDGTVRLSGRARSFAEIDLATSIASAVLGVRDVDSRILLDYGSERPDGEILSDIRRRLHYDVRVDAGRVAVSVSDGAVRLSGTTGSLAERRVAVSASRVAGVRDVDASDLEVRATGSSSLRKPPVDGDLAGDIVAAGIKLKLALNPHVQADEIEVVSVSRGIAVLRGYVPDLRARDEAISEALQTPGVRRVRSLIKVRPGSPVSDTSLAASIRTLFANDVLLADNDVSISVDDGRVVLRGVVNTALDRQWAREKVATVGGVVAIRNLLEVEYARVPTAYVPIAAGNVTVETQGSQGFVIASGLDDNEIEEDIASELFWSPMVDADRIDVAVENGVATLTGSVESWWARRQAASNAHEGGAWKVVNRLTVALGHAGRTN